MIKERGFRFFQDGILGDNIVHVLIHLKEEAFPYDSADGGIMIEVIEIAIIEFGESYSLVGFDIGDIGIKRKFNFISVDDDEGVIF